ncbi:putative cupredoxin-like copper-binding protein [Inhella inkyongensis]|uniref:Putative cupredoxin-like copper-binding protein n=1 Tax=Inhella inkyongensis TaxID=392593 RepID=A0A840S7U3_9BURK|nr:cupredoxin family protein [Inhella inkyongensis]MBB5204854.1 putative cupredoxin-like copper-binding protein [Inhella inkyongensis]
MKKFVIQALSLALLCGTAAWAHGPSHGPAAQHSRVQKDWGIAGTRAQRTVKVEMDDTMRFKPDRLEVREGETLRLQIHNKGKVMHEFVLGTPKELQAHAAMMQKFPDMAHDEPYMAHVPPGKTGEIVWTFNRPGEFQFACLIAGHFQAGMVGTLVVTPKGAKP